MFILFGGNHEGLDIVLDIRILDASHGLQERARDGGRGEGELARETGEARTLVHSTWAKLVHSILA